MYSPCAVAGSSDLLIRSSRPSAVTWTFISSSPSGFTSSTAITIGSPRAASSDSSTDAGCTVSPFTSSTPSAKWSRATQSE